MTLQYRSRNQYNEQTWELRLRLSRNFLVETVDFWFRSDEEFPTKEVVAVFLYVFSPRCHPNRVNEQQLYENLMNRVGTAEYEYSQTWPKRSEPESRGLIDAISEIVSSAADAWDNRGIHEPTVEATVEQIVDQIVAEQYVVFHHYQTTKRDQGGFRRFGHAG